MAIKTELTDTELRAVAQEWALGALASARGLPEGSINTLYVLETASGRCVLRLSEGRREAEVAFETALLSFLEAERFPAVRLVPRPDGARYGRVKERFACVFHWGAGEQVTARALTPERMLDVGRLLGRLHVLGEGFPGVLENRYGPERIAPWIDGLVDEAARPDRPADPELWAAIPLLRRERALFEALPASAEGVIHADLFPDNVLFVGHRVSTVLDFEMACRGPFVLDLATALHACCYDDDYVPARARALFDGYRQERRLTRQERESLHAWARFAALRFTVTRVLDFHRAPLAGDKLVRKDWRRFRDRLEKTIALKPAGLRELCGL